jgi:hypothetical protein
VKQHEPESIETNDPSADGTPRPPRVRLRAESPAKSVMGNLTRPPYVRLRAENPAKGVMGDLVIPPHVRLHAT